MFHHVAYSGSMARLARFALYAIFAGNLTTNKGTQVNRPTQTGFEPH